MGLEVVHAGEEPPASWSAAVFLAGPSPRDLATPSWRPAAVELLRRSWRGGRLVVFVPEPRGAPLTGYDGQVDWEERCLHLSDVVLFWVPRDLETLPGFTTNVEWGMWHDSGRAVFGAPESAPKNAYLRRYAEAYGVPGAVTLAGTVAAALRMAGGGAERSGGERAVPLLIWRTPGFQGWYAAQRAAGNTLEHARAVWTHPPGHAFYWALHVHVRIAAEGGRVKANEVVLSRPDLACAVLYRRAPVPGDTRVVLVREFRSSARTADGYVHELPGGGAFGPPEEEVLREVAEETGLVLDPARLRSHGSRQLAATMSAHHAHLFSAELTEAELAAVAAAGPRGVEEDGERTFPEVVAYGRVRAERLADWTTLGMIAQVLGEA